MRRLIPALGLGLALIAGGASVYTLRASGTPGCPARDDLRNPVIDFTQVRYYTNVTVANPNACYGWLNEPIEITLYGPNGRRAISYYGNGPAHSDVGICCIMTLPPHGTWSIRLGAPGSSQGSEDIKVCNIHVQAVHRNGLAVWKRMPDGGTITGHGSFPPKSKFDPDKTKPLPDDPTWREPCDAP